MPTGERGDCAPSSRPIGWQDFAAHPGLPGSELVSLDLIMFMSYYTSVCVYVYTCVFTCVFTSVCVCVFGLFFLIAPMLTCRHQQETQRCTTAVCTTRVTVWNCCWEPEPTHTSVIQPHTVTYVDTLYLWEHFVSTTLWSVLCSFFKGTFLESNIILWKWGYFWTFQRRGHHF